MLILCITSKDGPLLLNLHVRNPKKVPAKEIHSKSGPKKQKTFQILVEKTHGCRSEFSDFSGCFTNGHSLKSGTFPPCTETFSTTAGTGLLYFGFMWGEKLKNTTMTKNKNKNSKT